MACVVIACYISMGCLNTHLMQKVFLTCSCNVFLVIKEIYKENYALNCISEKFFIQIVVNEEPFEKICNCDVNHMLGGPQASIMMNPLVDE